jgi:hypothetical protein
VTRWLVGLTLPLLALGLLFPQTARRDAQILVVGLAAVVAFDSSRRLLARLPATTDTVFEGRQRTSGRAELPSHVEQMAEAPTWTSDQLSEGARRAITAVAIGRLLDHHGLSIDDPTHHREIEARVSPALWSMIKPREIDILVDRFRTRPPLPHSYLAPLVAELEAL